MDKDTLWQRPKSRLLLGIPIGALLTFFLGAFALGGFNWAIELTNETEFCLSCHEMAAFVFPEYSASTHYSNTVGIRAECVDCHLPTSNWFAKTFKKIYVSKDLYFHLTGKISTAERFEEHRLEMAQREWNRLAANDSAECRSCHTYDAMNTDEQDRFASRGHRAAIRDDQTCIDCHMGIVHALPADIPPAAVP